MGSYETYYDDGCAENPFGLDSSSDQLIHLPSLAVQQRSQSPLENNTEQGCNVTLPPLRVIIPHQFSPSSSPYRGIVDSPTRHVSNVQKASSESRNGQKRMKLDSLVSSPSSSAINDRVRSSYGQQDHVHSNYGETTLSRRSRRERSVSELSSVPPARLPFSSDVVATSDHSSRYFSPSRRELANLTQSSYESRQAQTLPALSAFNRGTTSFPGPDRESLNPVARSGTFETAHAAVTIAMSSNGMSHRWNRRSNSSDYSFHDRSHGFGTMVPGGAEFTDAAPPPYSWDMGESAENQLNRKRRGNLPKAATTMFKKWFDEHRDSPYPTEDEKARFCRETGLTMNQVGNWFINARRRQPNRGLRDGSGSLRDDI